MEEPSGCRVQWKNLDAGVKPQRTWRELLTVNLLPAPETEGLVASATHGASNPRRNGHLLARLQHGMDHTPQVPAGDDRPLKLLERTPVPEEHRKVLFDLVHTAQDAATAAGAELQSEFGKEHVALIVGCNQFVRLFRGGSEPGAVEVLLDAPQRQQLAQAGFTLGEPEGAVFKLFGWVRVKPMQGPKPALQDAVRSAFAKARSSGKK